MISLRLASALQFVVHIARGPSGGNNVARHAGNNAATREWMAVKGGTSGTWPHLSDSRYSAGSRDPVPGIW
jgi:hypothetical protein